MLLGKNKRQIRIAKEESKGRLHLGEKKRILKVS